MTLAAGPLGAVQAADREIARLTAVRARAVAEFAASRPASVDRQPGEPGCMSAERRVARPEVLADVSEWAAQELVVALSISAAAAEALLTRSLTLVHRLPKTLAALEAGVLHPGHLWPMLEKVAPIADAKTRREVEAGLLAWAAGRVSTPAQLGAKARRMVLARDARGAAQRLTAALRRRGVTLRGDDVDGMAAVTVLATVPEAQALVDTLGRYADAVDDEPGRPPRTRGQKMIDCLLDLVLRPGETDLPPVQAQWTIVAPVPTLAGGDQPGEIGGEPVPAEMIRSLARAFGLLPPVDDPDSVTGPDAEQDELDRWWAEVEERVLAEAWGGAEPAPDEELIRYWAQQSTAADSDHMEEYRHRAPEPEEGVPHPEDDPPDRRDAPVDFADGCPDPEESAGWWAAADVAVNELSGALWEVDVALGRARRAVERAEIADAADETDWQRGTGGG